MRLPTSTALGIRSAAERFLDRVKLGDALEGLAGDRSWRRSSLALATRVTSASEAIRGSNLNAD
ncbi:hypothetical protein GA0061098_104518 [Bradyrhizobium shewense]|uniref:Uncharacterized protein n=1 Tax=Bradyrhizobium shewense TaxID=1761772 RepID=A0A1C3XTJ8_9BRAD|nr:hypothetical protein GA0061098_104518 [Bradyrhizobium shewense]